MVCSLPNHPASYHQLPGHANRPLADTQSFSDPAVGLSLIQLPLRPFQQRTFELARATRSTSPDLQIFNAALLIALAIFMYPAAMAAEHLGHLARRGQAQASLTEHHRRKAQRPFVVLTASKNRAGGVDECQLPAVTGHRQVRADRFHFSWQEGDSVLQVHKYALYSPAIYYALWTPKSQAIPRFFNLLQHGFGQQYCGG